MRFDPENTNYFTEEQFYERHAKFFDYEFNSEQMIMIGLTNELIKCAGDDKYFYITEAMRNEQ